MSFFSKFYFVWIMSGVVVTLADTKISKSINSYKENKLVEDTTKYIFRMLPPKYKMIKEALDEVESKRPILKILYFTSSSVPLNSSIREIKDASKLMNLFNLDAKMVLIGLESNSLRDYMNNLTNKLRGLKKTQRLAAKVELAPMLFKKYKIDRVPAFAIGVCKNDLTHSEECNYKYIARGDAPLKYFLEILKDENPYFKELYEAL